MRRSFLTKQAEERRRFAARLRDLRPWQRHIFYSEGGLTYQTCRFCRRGFHGVDRIDGLWQYGVRHYICDDCKAERERA